MPWWFYLCIALGGYVAGYWPAAVLISRGSMKDKIKNRGSLDNAQIEEYSKNAAGEGVQIAFIWPLALVVFVLVQPAISLYDHLIVVNQRMAKKKAT